MTHSIYEIARANLTDLSANPDTGQGIVMGLNTFGDTALQIYWLTAREEEPTVDRATMREVDGCHVIANGSHIDGIVAGMVEGQSFSQSFKNSIDEMGGLPHAPRLAGILIPHDSSGAETFTEYKFTIARRGDPGRIYFADMFKSADSGIGRCINTYIGDGSLPSFSKHPYDVMPLGDAVDDTAEMYWEKLDADKRVAIAVKGIHLATKTVGYRVINPGEELELRQGVEQAPAN
jgi:hypothetical protein